MDDVILLKIYEDRTIRPAHPDVKPWEASVGTYSFDENGVFNYAIMKKEQAEYLGLI